MATKECGERVVCIWIGRPFKRKAINPWFKTDLFDASFVICDQDSLDSHHITFFGC